MYSENCVIRAKVLNHEARKEIAKDAKKTYECSGLFGKTLEGGKILKRRERRERPQRTQRSRGCCFCRCCSYRGTPSESAEKLGFSIAVPKTRFEIWLLLVSGHAFQACR